ncbi:hypothetical protein ACO1DC_07460 [Bacillus velezensis]
MNEELDVAQHTKQARYPYRFIQALCTIFIGASIKICNGEGTNYTFTLSMLSDKQEDPVGRSRDDG